MVKVCGKPLLRWIVEWLRDDQVTNIVIEIAYLKEHVMSYFRGPGID